MAEERLLQKELSPQAENNKKRKSIWLAVVSERCALKWAEIVKIGVIILHFCALRLSA